MRAVVFTLGCKVNEVESASIMAALEKLGWEVSDKLSPADMYVLNTCAVTKEAEKKSRQLVARAKKFNKDARIYVCGCASEKDKGQFEEKDVNYVIGAKDKAAIISAIAKDFDECDDGCTNLYPKQVKTRAFIKIQDGCNNFCSYCIIPYLRGRISSRTIDDIVDEVKHTASCEIVLTGINISSYQDGDKRLKDLMAALNFTEKRIRLGSLECNIIDDELLTTLKGLKNFAPQFHLSLQSGSTSVLKAMNRKYTREEYIEKCKKIYSYFPDAAITTDIIVGFCGESDSDFEDSLSIIREVGFARVHAFAFSPREGTKAYSMQDTPAPIKNERLHKLLAAAKVSEENYIKAHLNTVQEVIFEDYTEGYTTGYTAGYIKVYCKGKMEGIAKVRLLELFNDGAICQVCN